VQGESEAEIGIDIEGREDVLCVCGRVWGGALTLTTVCLPAYFLLRCAEQGKVDKKKKGEKEDVIQIHKPKQRTGGKKKFSCSIL